MNPIAQVSTFSPDLFAAVKNTCTTLVESPFSYREKSRGFRQVYIGIKSEEWVEFKNYFNKLGWNVEAVENPNPNYVTHAKFFVLGFASDEDNL